MAARARDLIIPEGPQEIRHPVFSHNGPPAIGRTVRNSLRDDLYEVVDHLLNLGVMKSQVELQLRVDLIEFLTVFRRAGDSRPHILAPCPKDVTPHLLCHLCGAVVLSATHEHRQDLFARVRNLQAVSTAAEI